MKNLDQAICLINDNKYIAFDIRLLVNLNVMEYNDILKYMQLTKLVDDYNLDFYNFRINSEKKLRKKFKIPKLDKIYDFIKWDIDKKEYFKKKEIETFFKFISENIDNIHLLQYCFNNKKNIKILNTTYFNDNVISDLLKRIGIEYSLDIISIDHIKELNKDTLFILSSTFQKKDKHNILILHKETTISKKEYHSLLRSENFNSMQELNFSIIIGFINNFSYVGKNYYEKIGFQRLGILLYGFCTYLKNNINDKNKKIYFLARDGFLVKEAFDAICDDFTSYYLYVSRRGTQQILKSKDINNNFKRYLRKINFDKNGVIVDIGWRCTFQNDLNKIIPQNNIKGYYIGLNINHINNLSMESYLGVIPYLSHFTGVFEILFTAPHAQTISYDKNGYVLDECEYDSLCLNNIECIHESAIEFVKKIDEFYTNLGLVIDKKEAFVLLKRVFVTPTREDIKMLGKFSFFNSEKQVVVSQKKRREYIFNLKQFIYDYKQCVWKFAFFKKYLGLSFLSKVICKFKYRG